MLSVHNARELPIATVVWISENSKKNWQKCFNLNKCGETFHFTFGEVTYLRLLEVNLELSEELKKKMPVPGLRDSLEPVCDGITSYGVFFPPQI